MFLALVKISIHSEIVIAVIVIVINLLGFTPAAAEFVPERALLVL